MAAGEDETVAQDAVSINPNETASLSNCLIPPPPESPPPMPLPQARTSASATSSSIRVARSASSSATRARRRRRHHHVTPLLRGQQRARPLPHPSRQPLVGRARERGKTSCATRSSTRRPSPRPPPRTRHRHRSPRACLPNRRALHGECVPAAHGPYGTSPPEMWFVMREDRAEPRTTLGATIPWKLPAGIARTALPRGPLGRAAKPRPAALQFALPPDHGNPRQWGRDDAGRARGSRTHPRVLSSREQRGLPHPVTSPHRHRPHPAYRGGWSHRRHRGRACHQQLPLRRLQGKRRVHRPQRVPGARHHRAAAARGRKLPPSPAPPGSSRRSTTNATSSTPRR